MDMRGGVGALCTGFSIFWFIWRFGACGDSLDGDGEVMPDKTALGSGDTGFACAIVVWGGVTAG